eukprot:12939773-Alexandrium_andersonii.AAC.1
MRFLSGLILPAFAPVKVEGRYIDCCVSRPQMGADRGAVAVCALLSMIEHTCRGATFLPAIDADQSAWKCVPASGAEWPAD